MPGCTSVGGIPIRLTVERWHHIVTNHPEMVSLRSQVLVTIENPEQIQQGDFGELLAIRRWALTSMGSKHLVAVYREVTEDDGFVVTASLSSQPSQRRPIVWTP